MNRRALVANLKRSGLEPERKAEVYMRWCMQRELSDEDVAACVGISRQGVAYALSRGTAKVRLLLASMEFVMEGIE